MPIRITCPHCNRGMLVDERLAGKKGRCKACQQVLTVPPLPASNSSAAESASAAPQAAAPADVEAEAAALFADEPKPAEQPVETKTIDLNCPFCDEAIHLPADLAGKRAQCPECKQIIKVPELEKKEPKDWRKVEARGPTGARLPEQPELEGAWGSTTARGVGQKTLEEAGLLPKVEKPRTLWQKIRLPAVVGSLVVLFVLIGLIGYGWWTRRSVEREVQAALTFVDSTDASPSAKAALALAAGEYYLRSGASHSDPRTGASQTPAKAANNQFGVALTTLGSAQGRERDPLLTDLALAEIELGGDKPETDEELRLPWDKTQQLLLPTLREIRNSEAKLYALRAVVQRLREHGQASRVLTLTNQLFPNPNADKAAALAVVGLEFLKAGDRSSAEIAVEAALQIYSKDAKAKDAKAVPLRSEVIALALLLDKDKKKLPSAGDNPDDKASEHIGKVEALARKGNWDDARKQASLSDDAVIRFRAFLAIAAAAVDAQPNDTTDIQSALKAAEDGLGEKAELAWSMRSLIELASRSTLPPERVQTLADQIGNTALRGRAQLAVLRGRLEKTNQMVEDSAADKIDSNSLSRSLGAQVLARHNARVGGSYTSVVQTWPQPFRSFGALGVALGLQDREK